LTCDSVICCCREHVAPGRYSKRFNILSSQMAYLGSVLAWLHFVPCLLINGLMLAFMCWIKRLIKLHLKIIMVNAGSSLQTW